MAQPIEEKNGNDEGAEGNILEVAVDTGEVHAVGQDRDEETAKYGRRHRSFAAA